MLLAIDIGNSNIVFGVYANNTWSEQWRMSTTIETDIANYGVFLRSCFLENNIRLEDIEHIVIGSVVPHLTTKLEQMVVQYFGKSPLLVGPQAYKALPLMMNNPTEIGADLVANALSAYDKFGEACIVVDFGTALTFTAVSDMGGVGMAKILGVSIAPGLRTAMGALSEQAANLHDVTLELPKTAIGLSTDHAMQSGVLIGYIGLVEYMISRMRQEIKGSCKVLATGGLSRVLTPLHKKFDRLDPYLTLDGFRLILEANL